MKTKKPLTSKQRITLLYGMLVVFMTIKAAENPEITEYNIIELFGLAIIGNLPILALICLAEWVRVKYNRKKEAC